MPTAAPPLRTLLAVFAGLTACLPTFPEAECYGDGDCAASAFCAADGRCLPRTAADGGVPDAGHDDAGQDPRDGGAGTDAEATWEIAPRQIAFGTVDLGCAPSERTSLLTNQGPDALFVRSVQTTAGTSTELWVEGPETPFTLGRDESVSLRMRYAPEDEGHDEGFVQLVLQDGTARDMIGLSGDGRAMPTVSDVHTQSAGKIDVLIVVDDGPDMSLMHELFGSQSLFLILYLDADDWDYQIAVTPAGPRGGPVLGSPRFVTPDLGTRDELLEANLQIGVDAQALHEPFAALTRALTEPVRSNENQGFLRPDASLLVLIFAARDDESVAADLSSVATLLEGLKGDPARSTVNAIAPAIFACDLDGGVLGREAVVIRQLTAATGGAFSNICQGDWSDALQTFPPGIRPRRFALSAPAVANSVTVEVSEQPIDPSPETWTYDPEGNAIVFADGAIPEVGANVTIRYRPAC